MASASSSSSLKALNAAGLLSESGKKRVKPADLVKDIEYRVVNLSSINGKYGRAIVCELEENAVILPRRFAGLMSDTDLQALNSKALLIIYRGSAPTRNGPTALFEFKDCSE